MRVAASRFVERNSRNDPQNRPLRRPPSGGGDRLAVPLLQRSLPPTSSEAKTRHRVSLVSAHVTTLEEDLKQQPLCQDCPKDVLSDSGLEIELAIPFVPNRDTPQQSEVVHYHPSE
ncbi:uncharacterized protein TNCV_3849811 [Trichonephila clavipes]|nr:uncharacterized protein TNCV_3849811 [Trichonephila clavipes]